MMKRNSESGVALLTVLMLLLFTSAMLAGFTTMTVTDQRLRAVDRTRTMAFYAAHGALEQMTAAVGNLFSVDFAPSAADLALIAANPPAIDGVDFEAPDGGPGYTLTPLQTDVNGNPLATTRTILTGPYQGFVALTTPYTLSVVAKTQDGSEAGSEVWLQRQMQTVAIPVFQFGIFSETDLSFFAGPNFAFGGRVHSNGNLYLASGNGTTLTLADRVTAVGEVIRTNLSNGWNTAANYTGNVRVTRGGGAFRNLATTEGSLTGTLGSAQNEPTWTNISIGTYNGHLRNGRTGARNLQLPFVTLGATPVDLIRRGVPAEPAAILGQRFYSLASLRILLSDTAAAITGLPGVTADAPIALDAAAPAGYVVDATRAPLAVSSGVAGDGYRSPANTPLNGGFIKIEMQTAGGWQDVTLEILNLGIAGRNQGVAGCLEPAPDAVIRIQRLRNNPVGGGCGNGSLFATDYWPNVLYDTREGNLRDTVPVGQATMFLGGVMHFIELDVANLSRWFQGNIGATGANALNNNGFTVYFSDRRGNSNAGVETGEYGFEDYVNPNDAAGTPNAVLDAGEDLNANAALDNYGQTPIVPGGATAPLTAAASPTTLVTAAEARTNRAILFRRALKLTNGGLGNLVQPGLTIAAENPVYVQGNYNANAGGFQEPNSASAVIADAVTLLSNQWNDNNSINNPHRPGNRVANTAAWYRLAIIAGKGPSFPQPGAFATPQDFGTDGGVHNFLRYLEDWNAALNYRGSIASFYFNRQAVGVYKCCTNVYSPPTRGYTFDVEFLQPALLPPNTPMFRDLNATGFTQVIR